MQVIQLEKMVKQMEEQQDRAQAQRTRLETRIAQLELAAKEKNQRYVKERCVSSLNIPKSQRNKSPSILLQPTPPPTLQELRPSPPNEVPESPKIRTKTCNSLNLKSPRLDISSKYSSSPEKRKSPKENNGLVKRLEGGRCSGNPGLGQDMSPEEVLAYEMRESLYDWLMRPSKSPRKPEYDYERYSYTVSSPRVKKLMTEYSESRRRQNQSSRESLTRGYKKRSFRAHRPYCDYQSPRKPTPNIHVRRYTA